MLTAYDMYTAEIFDEAGIPVLLVGDCAGNNVYGFETTVPVTVDHLVPLVRGGHQRGQARDGRRRPAVRLLPGQPAAGPRHRDPVHEGGHGARGQARGRQADGARGRAARARRHPRHGPHRLHPAERARARRLQGAGPRRRRRPADRGRPRARGRRLLRHRHGDGARRRWRRGSPRRCASRRSASAPARTATPRCSSGRTWPGCAVAARRGSSRSTPTCARDLKDAASAYAAEVASGTFPAAEHSFEA